jgi:RimJ/RimL family protein N-acetyltransferase
LNYKALKKEIFTSGDYSLVPIRFEDRYDIMHWRNEQIYHLRQQKELTREDQDKYFKEVVAGLFEQKLPNQILFSYLKEDKCIGYGGLVHINWIDKNAEISFVMDSSLENEYFEFHWKTYLNLIEQVAFRELAFRKIFTYAYDLRPKLYAALLKSGFTKEATLKDHTYFNGKFIDVMIHSKLNNNLKLRLATENDLEQTFQWAINKDVRKFSFNQNEIKFEEHRKWFLNNLNSNQCQYYILEYHSEAVGSIRFDIAGKQGAKINYLINPKYFGKGFGTKILSEGEKFLKRDRPEIAAVFGIVMQENLASKRIFEKLKYKKVAESQQEIKYEKTL